MILSFSEPLSLIDINKFHEISSCICIPTQMDTQIRQKLTCIFTGHGYSAPRENLFSGICGQRRPSSDCASAQSDQGLRYPLTESLSNTVWIDGEQITRMRLCACVGWIWICAFCPCLKTLFCLARPNWWFVDVPDFKAFYSVSTFLLANASSIDEIKPISYLKVMEWSLFLLYLNIWVHVDRICNTSHCIYQPVKRQLSANGN